ncbi:MAG: BatD family protein [Bdellovibrionota bacterium]
MLRIGKGFARVVFFIWFSLGTSLSNSWAAPHFTAEVDRNQISERDSVTLKMVTRIDGVGSVSEPQFVAPDFEIVNSYDGSFLESFYENGLFGVRNHNQATRILRPRKAGTLRISGIQVTAHGVNYKAPDISVYVSPGGGGTPPPKGYSSGAGAGLRGTPSKTGSRNVFVRAEVDKSKAFKGEQVVVSYYLYRKVRVFNITVEKFPIAKGFLREDLEMPVMGHRLDTEHVILAGVPYERSLLMRYAVYPLQEGTLQMDSVVLKYNYYGVGGTGGGDEDDPFFNFFRQMTPRNGDSRSELVPIEVVSIPEEGRPDSFTGGVGDFTVAGSVDKYEVRANEALTWTIKVEGRGNVAAIGEPKAKWPESIEVYDSKSRASPAKVGLGQKIFEILLIPRVPGNLTLPRLEFSFFDPAKKMYITKSVEPVSITVNEGKPGSNHITSKKTDSPVTGVGPKSAIDSEMVNALKPPEPAGGLGGQPFWRWLYRISAAAFLLLFVLFLKDLFINQKIKFTDRARSEEKALSKSWSRLKGRSKKAKNGASWQDVHASYELLTGAIYDGIDRAFQLGSRSLSRAQLKEILVGEKRLSVEVWARLERLLEYGEMVRFASSAGAVSQDAARTELEKWVNEGERLIGVLSKEAESQPPA